MNEKVIPSSPNRPNKIIPEDDEEIESVGEEIEYFDLVSVLKVDETIFEDDKAVCCSITCELFTDPVFCNGFSFEKSAIVRWFEGGSLSNPITGEKLSPEQQIFFENREKRSEVNYFRQRVSKTCNGHIKDFLEMTFSSNIRLNDESVELIERLIERANEVQPENSQTLVNSMLCYTKLLGVVVMNHGWERIVTKREKCFKKYYDFLIRSKQFTKALKLLRSEEGFEESERLIFLYLKIQEFSGLHPDRSLRLKFVRILIGKDVEVNADEELARFWMWKMTDEEHDIESLVLYRKIVLSCIPKKDFGVNTLFSLHHLDLLCQKHLLKEQFQECYDCLITTEMPKKKPILYNKFVIHPRIHMVPIYEKFRKILPKEFAVPLCLKLASIFGDKGMYSKQFRILQDVCQLEPENVEYLKHLFESKFDLLKRTMQRNMKKQMDMLKKQLRLSGVNLIRIDGGGDGSRNSLRRRRLSFRCFSDDDEVDLLDDHDDEILYAKYIENELPLEGYGPTKLVFEDLFYPNIESEEDGKWESPKTKRQRMNMRT